MTDPREVRIGMDDFKGYVFSRHHHRQDLAWLQNFIDHDAYAVPTDICGDSADWFMAVKVDEFSGKDATDP